MRFHIHRPHRPSPTSDLRGAVFMLGLEESGAGWRLEIEEGTARVWRGPGLVAAGPIEDVRAELAPRLRRAA